MILKFVLLVHIQDAINTQIIITLIYTVELSCGRYLL